MHTICPWKVSVISNPEILKKSWKKKKSCLDNKQGLSQINFPALTGQTEVPLRVTCPVPWMPARPMCSMEQNKNRRWLSVVFNTLLASRAAAVFVWPPAPAPQSQVSSSGANSWLRDSRQVHCPSRVRRLPDGPSLAPFPGSCGCV